MNKLAQASGLILMIRNCKRSWKNTTLYQGKINPCSFPFKINGKKFDQCTDFLDPDGNRIEIFHDSDIFVGSAPAWVKNK